MPETIPNQYSTLRETKQLIYTAKKVTGFLESGTLGWNKLILIVPVIANLTLFSKFVTV